jgi:WD repeat and SOF domain-containing protein 1
VRAIAAAKIAKFAAKPFVGALNGHSEGVYSILPHPNANDCVLSAGFDSIIQVWSLRKKTPVWGIPDAHGGRPIRGMSFPSFATTEQGRETSTFISAGDDGAIHQWALPFASVSVDALTDAARKQLATPLRTWQSSSPLTAVQFQRTLSAVPSAFSSSSATAGATAGGLIGSTSEANVWFGTSSASGLTIWDVSRSDPLREYRDDWTDAGATTLRFSPTETHLVATAASDCSIMLYDLRGDVPMRKVRTRMRTNAISWNPVEPFVFATASEDHNMYTWDLRKLDKALQVYKDHLYAVLDVDYSPTGRQLLTGSYDRTVRLWNASHGRSTCVYHGQRMQRVFATRFSPDSRFIYSGSDDGNVRIWKTDATAPLRPMPAHERQAREYQKRLRREYRHLPEVRSVAAQERLPKDLYRARKLERVQAAAEARKNRNRNAVRKEGTEYERIESMRSRYVDDVQE